MKLIYSETKIPVQVGDFITLDAVGYVVEYFTEPHKPASEGLVTLRVDGGGTRRELYVSVIGAEWIEREDREPEPSRRRRGSHATTLTQLAGIPFVVGRRYRTRDGQAEGTYQGASGDPELIHFVNVTGTGEVAEFANERGYYPTFRHGRIYRNGDESPEDFIPTPVD